jgi:hypothetical protein
VLPDAVQIISRLSSSAIIGCVITFLFWKADDFLSDTARKLIYNRIAHVASTPDEPAVTAALREFIDRYYARDLPFWRFVKYLILFSVSSVIIILGLYIIHTDTLLRPLLPEFIFTLLLSVRFRRLSSRSLD